MRILAVLVLAAVTWASPRTCKECGSKFDHKDGYSYAMTSFCSEFCRDDYAERDKSRTAECEICGYAVQIRDKEYVSGNTRYVTIGEPPVPKYCYWCRRDIGEGKIDPDNPPMGLVRPPEGEDREPQKQYWEEELERKKGNKGRLTDDEAEGGFGALTWVAIIVGSIGFLMRWLLK